MPGGQAGVLQRLAVHAGRPAQPRQGGAAAADFEPYPDGFSDNFKEILAEFKFHNQVPTLHEHDRLGHLIGKLLDRSINLSPDPAFSLVTRSSDGQLLFMANKLAKMKPDTPLGSRIAEVHNGSSLFTGDAGQGESNVRRWIIENDWLEAIVALPLDMFYNTGIATYIWVLTNRKAGHRRGQVKLIDATGWYKPLGRNLGKKNCEPSPDDVKRITDLFLAFEESGCAPVTLNARPPVARATRSAARRGRPTRPPSPASAAAGGRRPLSPTASARASRSCSRRPRSARPRRASGRPC